MHIDTPRLHLRPITLADLETTHAYSADPAATRLMMFLPFDSREETAEALAQSVEEWGSEHPERLEFAIERDGAHIGSITMYFQGPPEEMELGWVLHPAHWNRGYATEAARALIDQAQKMGIRRVFACCDAENAASYQVMRKLGMQEISRTPGRRNRGMDEDRVEIVCELWLEG